MSKRDGGPAFPLNPVITPLNDYHVPDGCAERFEGMSFRDACALAALPAIIRELRNVRPGVMPEAMDAVAETAYQFADAMLAQRDKEPS